MVKVTTEEKVSSMYGQLLCMGYPSTHLWIQLGITEEKETQEQEYVVKLFKSLFQKNKKSK